MARKALKFTQKLSGRLKSKIGGIIAKFSKNIRDGGRWGQLTNQVKLVFFKSRAFGICQTAQAKITLKISGGLWRDHIPVSKKSFFKNCTTCTAGIQPFGYVIFAVVLCCKTTSVWPNYCVVKTLKNLMTKLVMDFTLIILYQHFQYYWQREHAVIWTNIYSSGIFGINHLSSRYYIVKLVDCRLNHSQSYAP